MGTAKRERQKANRQARLAEAEKETTKEDREQTTRRLGVFAGIAAAVILLVLLVGFLTRGGDDSGADFSPTPVPEAAAEAPTPVPLTDSIPEDFEAWSGNGGLSGTQPPARRNAYFEAPPMLIDPDATYSAAINTSVGPIRLNLFADTAPLTVNNFVALARDGFYDGMIFHRVIDDFMAQGGDPTGIGIGGPGYEFGDEIDPSRTFDKAGLLAMANSGPGTNGSQFFITFGPTGWLDGNHTIFGELACRTGSDDPEECATELALLDQMLRVQPDPAAPGEAPPPGTATVMQSISIVES